MKDINFRTIIGTVLVFVIMVVTIPSTIILANDETSYITDSRYTSSKLYKGDRFDIELDFVPLKGITSIQSIEVSGEAVDTTNYVYDIVSLSTGEVKEDPIGIGEIVTLDLDGLVYTGKGDTIQIIIKHTTGTLKQEIVLDTITTEEIKGALLLDPSVPNNMSASIDAGDSKELSLTIKNISNETMKGGIVKINLAKTTVGLAITKGQYIELSTLTSGSSREIKFTIDASDEVKAGTYEIQVDISGMNQTILLEVRNDDKEPIIDMKYPEDVVFNSGEANKFDLTLTNNGSDVANNVKLYLESKEGVGLIGTSNMISVGDLNGKSSVTIPINMQIESAKSGQLITVPFKVTYTTKSGEKIEEIQEIYLNVESEGIKEAEISIIGAKVSKTSVNEGESFNLSFGVIADVDAKNVKISVKMPIGILATSQNTFIIDELEAGKSKTFTISCVSSDKAEEGYQPIELVAEYEYGDGKTQISQYTGVNNIVIGEEDDNITQAKVIIADYEITPRILSPGDEGTLTIHIMNTHETETVKNLTATYTTSGESQIISPIGTGNTLYNNSILPGQKVTQTLKFKVSKNADTKDYQLNAQLNYETDNVDKVETTQTIILSISEQGIIQVGALEDITISAGKAVPLTIPLYNRGSANLDNVMIYLEGEGFTVKDNELYISSFGVGSTEYYLPTITPESDNVNINLVIEYEDEEGVMERVEYPLDLGDSSNKGSGLGGSGKEGGLRPGKNGEVGAMGNMSLEERQGMMENIGDMTEEERQAFMNKMGKNMSDNTGNKASLWIMGIVMVVVSIGGFIVHKLLKDRKKMKGQDEYENL